MTVVKMDFLSISRLCYFNQRVAGCSYQDWDCQINICIKGEKIFRTDLCAAKLLLLTGKLTCLLYINSFRLIIKLKHFQLHTHTYTHSLYEWTKFLSWIMA
jgi:hypothetical protein